MNRLTDEEYEQLSDQIAENPNTIQFGKVYAGPNIHEQIAQERLMRNPSRTRRPHRHRPRRVSMNRIAFTLIGVPVTWLLLSAVCVCGLIAMMEHTK